MATVIEHDPGDVRRFYEMICFTRSLSPVRGNRIKQVFSAESDGFEIAKCRRDFADAIAYFCAYKADPDNVTAVALGRKDTKVVLWVASNANVPAKVIDFLNNRALNVVQRLACADMKQGQLPPSEYDTALMLLGEILQFTRKKIFKYYKPAIAAWKKIRKAVNPKGSDNTNSDLVALCRWFETKFYKSGVMLEECDMPDLAVSCYIARTKKTFDILDHGSGQGNEQSLDYERLYKLLNKLGKHVLFFKRMLRAIVALRLDFQKGFVVESIPASIPKPIPLPQLSKRTMKKIIARIFPKEDERSRFYHHLDQFYNMEEISQSLKLCTEKGRVRVHAEILLIDYFDKVDVNFLDNNDKYIGCSKPACYLCYQYICQHPDSYTLPQTHQKLYHAWTLPIVRADDRNCTDKFKRHKRFLNQVTENLQSGLRNEMRQQVAPRKYHADSSAGASSIANTNRARPIPKTSDHHVRVLIQSLSEEISAKYDVDFEDGGVMLHC